MKDFYNSKKALLFTVKAHIAADLIRINIKNMSVEEQNKISNKVEAIKKKSKKNYEFFKTQVKLALGENITFIENKKFNVNYLRILFKKSPDEYKNLLSLKINSFSDIYDIKNEKFLFYIRNSQTSDIVQQYDEVKANVIKNFIDAKMQDMIQKKMEQYKATNKQNIYVENPFALIYK